MVTGSSDPMSFRPETVHARLMVSAPRVLGYRPDADFAAWRAQLVAKTAELLRCPVEQGNLDVRVAFEGDGNGFVERRLVFSAEPGADVPCHLLLPADSEPPFPVMICLQGHNTGMHISLGRAKFDGDNETIAGDRDFAVQAVRQGFAALVMEQRGFGERRDRRPAGLARYAGVAEVDDNRTCKHAAMAALLVGRTLLGERVFDLRRACDLIETLDGVDTERIFVLGHSGGGTVAWYGAAVEPRIRGAILASCFATVESSIGSIDHCVDNYLPGMLEWFDYADLAGAIAPRPALVVMGKDDPIFPHDGVQAAFDQAAAIYDAAGAADAVRLVFGDGGHRFYAEPAWPAFKDLLASRGGA